MILRFADEREGDGWKVVKIFEHPFIGKYTIVGYEGSPKDIEQGISAGVVVLVLHVSNPAMNIERPERKWGLMQVEDGGIEWVVETGDAQQYEVGPRPDIPKEIALYAEELAAKRGWMGVDAEEPEEDAIAQMHDLSTDELLDAWEAAGPDERAQIETIMNIRSRAGR